MKGRLLFFVALLSTACSVIEIEESTSLQKEAIRETLRLKSADSLFYHSQSGMCITPDSDALSLFTNCSSADSRPTHLAVKFYPKSREEQHYLSNLEGISVSYIPFGYVPVKTDSYRKSDLQNVPVFNESNPYTLTISGECEVDSVDGSVCRTTNETVTLALPVMYAIWPADMSLPDIEHQTVYEFRMPEPDRAIVSDVYPLKLVTYDSLLCRYVPLRNVKVSITTAGVTTNMYSKSDGSASFRKSAIASSTQFQNSTVSITLETPKWTIVRDNSPSPIHVVLGKVIDLWLVHFVPDTAIVTLSSVTSEYEIHRAVDYYHNSVHELTDSISTQEYGVLIHAFSTPDGESSTTSGRTYTSSHYIEMYFIECSHSERIASVCHELGHIRHYRHYSAFSITPSIIRESYATFVGWYLGRDYYLSKGLVSSYPSDMINWQARQSWTLSSGSPYSPLFIDLNDDYNQWTTSGYYLYDDISGVPISQLDYIGGHCTSISQCAALLRANAGTYYTLSQINSYLENYE